MMLTQTLPEKFKVVNKPATKKSLKAFIGQQAVLIEKKNYKKVKLETEKALKSYDYGQIPVDGTIYLLCAKANLELGYLIIAENLLGRCFQYKDDFDLNLQARNLLGRSYREQGQYDKACEEYEKVIKNDDASTELIHSVAFDLGQIYAQQQIYDKALIYFGIAIEYASSDVLSIKETKLAEYYMHRSSVFEALGMLEHAKLDIQKILDADPSFVQRYHQMAIKYEESEMLVEAAQVRQFLQKLLL